MMHAEAMDSPIQDAAAVAAVRSGDLDRYRAKCSASA
jgi:hypothetical protein